MAIAAVPFLPIYLVEHVSGGAIIHAAGGYVANTFVNAAVISAFTDASAALAAAVTTITSAPVLASVGAIAVAAAGAYCYFYGIPAPVEAFLIEAGLATSAKGGLAVTVVKLATALAVLGVAGLMAFNIYKRIWQARGAIGSGIDPGQARHASETAFGTDFWKHYGEAVWLGVTDTRDQILGWASNAISGVQKAGSALLPPPEAAVDGIGGGVVVAGAYGGAAAGAAYAASTVTVLGSSTLGGVGLSLGLVSAPVWPVVAGAIGAGALALTGWKVARSYLKSPASTSPPLLEGPK
ncbi:MAG: hypothetical protein QM676_10795 [Novosphingobium sp.]